MKKIGMIGGLSWQSTVEYYKAINSMVQERRGGNEAAELILHSLNFAAVETLQRTGKWAELESLILKVGQQLENYGADCVMICANTVHKMAPTLEAKLKIPLIHIVDATAGEIKKSNMSKVGLLGTRYTMIQTFYKDRLKKHSVEAIVPTEDDIEIIHQIIHNELMANDFRESSRKKYLDIMQGLADQGAEGIILGCTEIPLLIRPGDTSIPTFDSMLIHARAAVDFAVSK